MPMVQFSSDYKLAMLTMPVRISAIRMRRAITIVNDAWSIDRLYTFLRSGG